MKRTNYGRYMPLLLVLWGVLLTGCKKTSKKETAGMVPPIEVSTPEVRDIMLTETYPGYLQAFNTVNLVARVSGYLQQIQYQVGQRVNKGQTLFVIEPTQYQDNLHEAEASVAQAKATLDYAKATYERTKQAALANAVSEIQVIQTKANYDQAIASLKNSEAQLETAKTNLGYCYVTAPFTGRVTKNQFDVGNFLSGSSSPTLATIYQDDKLYVNFSVADNQYLNMAVKRDDPEEMGKLSDLTVMPNAQANLPSYKAKLDYLAPNVDVSTGTMNLRGIIDNSDGLLRDGLYVKVVLPYREKKDAILIQDASIGTDQLGRYVYVVNDSSKVEYRKLEVGQLVNDTLRLVLSGLKPNDRYVTQALLKVRPGMPVKPILKGTAVKEAVGK
ncbi:MAG: efflux RND transporter periplasmic adaptor subunit [Bacteroidales bacterium]